VTQPDAPAPDRAGEPSGEHGPISRNPAEERLARWMERAAAHQTRALIWLRQARDPTAGPLSSTRRRALLVRALEHLLAARRLLLRAHEATDRTELRQLLDSHLARLAQTTTQTERLLQELDAAAGG
jgi:hypothetical protein